LYQKVISVTPHHLYYSMCSKCPPTARTQAADVDATHQQHVDQPRVSEQLTYCSCIISVCRRMVLK